MEILNGNTCLFVQTHGEQVTETRTYVVGENDKLKMGIYEIQGKKYFGAFTDLDLLEKWLKVRGSYAQLSSKVLLEMAEETKVDGIIINSSLEICLQFSDKVTCLKTAYNNDSCCAILQKTKDSK